MNLLAFLYPISFGICLFSLVLWFFFRNDKSASSALSKSFIGFFIVYLVSLAFSPAETSYKMLILFRDLMVLGLSTQMINFFKHNKAVFFGLLVALVAMFKFAYFKVMQNTFPQHQTTSISTSTNETTDNISADGEWLMDLKNGASIDVLKAFFEENNISYEQAFTEIEDPEMTELDDYFVLDIPNNANRAALKEKLQQTGYVDWLEGNEVIKTDLNIGKAPTTINKDYGINDPGLKNLWGFDKMELDQLYNIIRENKIKPKKKALVAILDTGIDSQHEDIKENYESLNKRYDMDPQGHGTHCAGIAAAVSNNNKGIASFSPTNEFFDVTSVKVLNQFGMGTQRDIIKGILFAADKGASVISLSLGGPTSDSSQKAYNNAVRYANKKGVIVTVAAGNESKDATGVSPANAEGVITVTAIDVNLKKASFSNTVDNIKMGIAAPGANIYSTFPKNQYKFLNGTSMATPYVAGLLGMMKALNPDLNTKDAHDILTKTGIDTDMTKKTGKFIQPAKVVTLMTK